MSGELPGHYNTLTSFQTKQSFTSFEVWQGAESCWKIAFSTLSSSASFLSSGMAFFSTKGIYYCSFIIPGIANKAFGPEN